MPPSLTIVPRAAGADAGAPAGAVALAVAVLLAGTLATAVGADRARRPPPAAELADETVRLAVERGNDSPAARAPLLRLRRAIARNPLDSRARVVYASTLLAVSRSVDDTSAAAFHARRAAELAPVTLPVVRPATLVLAHTRRVEAALELIRGAFDCDAEDAAELLARVEPLLGDVPADVALPDAPGPWLAWTIRLEREGREDEARDRLERAAARWPDHLPTVEWLARREVDRRDWTALDRLLPANRELPESAAAARILLYRALGRARRGEPPGPAQMDVERALRLGGSDRAVRLQAGETLLALGDAAGARRQWSRVLFELPAAERGQRAAVLRRLAALEAAQGRPATALRLWRQILDAEPRDAEARSRIAELTGLGR